MRVTNQLFFNNTRNNYQTSMKGLFATNQQLATGLKIQHNFENTGVYVDAMRLDYEATTLAQVKQTSTKAQTFANNTDKALSQFSSTLDQFKVKLVQSANDGAMSDTSREALANDLEALKTHLMNIANTSINGTFLFSGTATGTKPIGTDGAYNGNGESLNALVGSQVQLAYNIDGQSLFLGSSGDYSKKVSTNMPMFNLTKLHPGIMQDNEGEVSTEVYLKTTDTIRDMVGDTDADTTNDPNTMFYLSGVNSYGEAFNTKIEMTSDASVEDLLERIGHAYGNTSTNKVVHVELNDHGQIEVTDLRKGSNQLEFHLFGAVDRSAAAGTAGNADVTNLDTLFTQPNVDIVEFMRSDFKADAAASTVASREDFTRPGIYKMGAPLTLEDGSKARATTNLTALFPANVDHVMVGTTQVDVDGTTTVQDLLTAIETEFPTASARIENGQIFVEDASGTFSLTMTAQDAANVDVAGFKTFDAANFERRGFELQGNQLSGNISQIINETGAFAVASTKLSETSTAGSLEGTKLVLEVVDIQGNPRRVEIDLASPQSTFSVDMNNDGTMDDTYVIFNANGGDTAANDITYRQLMDIVGMVTGNQFPITPDSDGYNTAITNSRNRVDVKLDHQGQLQIIDKTSSVSKMRLSMYDENANTFGAPSALGFMSNNAIVIDEPTLDIFRDLDIMIEAVRNGTYRADGSNGDRNPGVQNAIERLDHIMDHVTRQHTKIGSLSNALRDSAERATLLEVNVKSVKSEIIDVDYGEAMMQFQQYMLAYQAMLSTVSQINQLSLVKYM